LRTKQTFDTAQRYLKLQNQQSDTNVNNGTRHTMDQTDLHKAALMGDVERVKELLKKGADPNIQDKYGWTPLHNAAFEGHFDVVELLLVHEADPTVEDKDGKTPLDLARVEGYGKVVSVIKERLRRRGGPPQRRF
jgi:ankyrin repeat protein